jgi:predicted RNase H-like HicB family nuclease
MPGTRYIAAYIVKDKETGLYVGIIPGMPGAHTQGETLDELHKNLIEVVKLCLEQMPAEDKERLPEFVGIQKVEVVM